MNPDVHESAKLLSPASDHCFFGYYDKSPWSGDERRLLYHRVDFRDRQPTSEDVSEILLHDLGSGQPTVVGRTTAWNFQMGSSLQWLGPDYDRFAFNDREEGSFVARIHSEDGDRLHTIDSPLYAADPKGGSAITIDFGRLQRTRQGYGYPPSNQLDDLADVPVDDGLYWIPLPNGEAELVVSIDRLASADPVPSMEDGAHWINHISYSPSGERVAFLHRWELVDGGMYTRLFTVRPDGSDLDMLVDSGKVTHYAWQSDTSIVAWSRSESSISEASKQGLFKYPIVSQAVNLVRRVEVPSWIRQNVIGDQYYRYDVEDGTSEPVATGVLNRDGHPSFTRDGRWMVTDTYPNSTDERQLLLYEFESSERFGVGSFRSCPAIDSTPFRCDLHPRWNRTGTHVCFDSLHEGHRGVYLIDVSDLTQ